MKYAFIAIYPFLGTLIGSSFVFVLKNNFNKNIEKIMLGFASGVMLAASIWSLLIPAIELASNLKMLSWLPGSIGFLFGIMLMIIIEKILYKKRNNKMMMPLVVTLHNIPEGMAVGVALASTIYNNELFPYLGALALSIGIAIQNLPEGAIISMTLATKGKSKFKSFLIGVLSGIVEPIASVITLLFTNIISTMLPGILSFASGAMIYVIVEELIPSAQEKESKILIISLTFGFLIMMILDVMLG